VREVSRQALVGGLSPLAGLAFGISLAALWIVVTDATAIPADWEAGLVRFYRIVSGMFAAVGWVILFSVWRRSLPLLSKIIVMGMFVGCAGMTGIGGIVWGQSS
jgi:hypothetical protein